MKPSILVPIDFSSITPWLLEEARQFAKAFNAQIWMLHVASTRVQNIAYEIPLTYLRDDVASHLRKSHQMLNEHRQTLQDEGFDATSMLVQHESPASKIVQEAVRLNARMILLGSHGHGRLHRMFTGSVCSSVLKNAPCPVVIVPSRTAEARQTATATSQTQLVNATP